MKKTRHRKHDKTVLRLADLEHAKSAVLNSLASPAAQRRAGGELAPGSGGILQRCAPRLRA